MEDDALFELIESRAQLEGEEPAVRSTVFTGPWKVLI